MSLAGPTLRSLAPLAGKVIAGETCPGERRPYAEKTATERGCERARGLRGGFCGRQDYECAGGECCGFYTPRRCVPPLLLEGIFRRWGGGPAMAGLLDGEDLDGFGAAFDGDGAEGAGADWGAGDGERGAGIVVGR